VSVFVGEVGDLPPNGAVVVFHLRNAFAPPERPLADGERPPVLWELAASVPKRAPDAPKRGKKGKGAKLHFVPFAVVRSPDPVTLALWAVWITTDRDYRLKEIPPPSREQQAAQGLPPIPGLLKLAYEDGDQRTKPRQPRRSAAWPLVRLVHVVVRALDVGSWQTAKLLASVSPERLPATLRVTLPDGAVDTPCGGMLMATGPVHHEPCLTGTGCRHNGGGPCLWRTQNALTSLTPTTPTPPGVVTLDLPLEIRLEGVQLEGGPVPETLASTPLAKPAKPAKPRKSASKAPPPEGPEGT